MLVLCRCHRADQWRVSRETRAVVGMDERSDNGVACDRSMPQRTTRALTLALMDDGSISSGGAAQ